MYCNAVKFWIHKKLSFANAAFFRCQLSRPVTFFNETVTTDHESESVHFYTQK